VGTGPGKVGLQIDTDGQTVLSAPDQAMARCPNLFPYDLEDLCRHTFTPWINRSGKTIFISQYMQALTPSAEPDIRGQ
jgi:hypothetical protein